MLQFECKKGVEFCDGLTRRDFLRVGALSAGAVGLSLADFGQLSEAGAVNANHTNCIILFLVGGPSHLDTWDLKPEAPESVRGPFKPIKTNVPGIAICEHFPRMAKMADQYAIIRSVHHRAAPIHETGHQLMQTGHLFRNGQEYPHYGSVVSRLRGPKPSGLAPFVILPEPIGNTGVSVSHGQSAGYLGEKYEPYILSGESTTDLDPARLPSRTALLDALDVAHRAYERTEAGQRHSHIRQQAFGQVFSAMAKMFGSLRASYQLTAT